MLKGTFLCVSIMLAVGSIAAVPDPFELLIAPLSPKTFFKSYFEKQHLVFPREGNDAKKSFLLQLAAVDQLYGQFNNPMTYLEARFDSLDDNGAVDLRNATGERINYDSLDVNLFLTTGQSAVVKLEYLNETLPLSVALATRFSTDISTHPYISAPNAQALAAHTDPYDVFVVQTHGQKHWTICTPQPGAEDVEVSLSQADLAEWYALRSNKAYSCHSGNLPGLCQMQCENVTLTAGDVLYLPKVSLAHAKKKC